MKHFNRLFAGIMIIVLLLTAAGNFYLLRSESDTSRPYLVEIERAALAMEPTGTVPSPAESNYIYIVKIVPCESNATLTAPGRYDYCIREVNGQLYRFEYVTNAGTLRRELIFFNLIFILVALLLFSVFFYIKRNILKPFHTLEEVPYELSKGNLTVPLTEEKQRYFGRFVWGTNMLREQLEERRKRELALHKEKKTHLMSLAHDVKTPLSVIRLNAQALFKGLYREEEKRKGAARSIIEKADEIEGYLSRIIDTSRDDFLDLTVRDGECYLSEVVRSIEIYYRDKTALRRTEFVIAPYDDCLLRADMDRLIEVLQNLMENALKYGDGSYIGLSFAREEGCVLIEVRNSGASLPPDELQHIFESFYRGSNVGDNPGSGLGLYICRKLMTLMNGDIFATQREGEFAVTVVVGMV